jgi:alpha-L-rhamnosidase
LYLQLAGTRIVFYPGEQAGNSGVSQASTGSPIFDAYTLSGADVEWYAPKFMYHGMQYIGVNVTWTPSVSDITGYAVRADNEQVLSFSTSNQLFNDIHRIIDRSIQVSDN